MSTGPRMQNPALVVPGAMDALLALGRAERAAGLGAELAALVHLRASQINGCGLCLQMHARELRTAGAAEEKIDTVAGWRDAPHFTDAERAALELTECVTRLADRGDAVPDDVFENAAAEFDEKVLGALILTIGQINLWNRLNVTTHQLAGSW